MSYSRKWDCLVCGDRCESMDWPKAEICDVCSQRAIRSIAVVQNVQADVGRVIRIAWERGFAQGYEKGKEDGTRNT